ncbi:MAG: peptidoglycan DD-metalloendopeptidase family protein [Candidatus Eisenbacteria bacterium]|nr:peptidoglycan DD-metalloendopeptidase family protein [Candidatus Eisenbacteria bacterium]
MHGQGPCRPGAGGSGGRSGCLGADGTAACRSTAACAGRASGLPTVETCMALCNPRPCGIANHMLSGGLRVNLRDLRAGRRTPRRLRRLGCLTWALGSIMLWLTSAGGGDAAGDETLLAGPTSECRLPVAIEWGPPLPPPLRLTGTFGEFRSGHLHAGVDFSTGGRTGMPVLAVHDGSVVRMRAGAGGYGRALYLRTEAGPLAVYGHLERFAAPLEAELRRRQAAQGEYEIDCHLEAGRFRFERGETLAVSGATGAGPPHLHFELRDGDVPVNPLICGLAAPDLGAPEIGPVRLHPLTPHAYVTPPNGTWTVSRGQSPRIWGPVGLEAFLIDRSGLTGARLAPLAARLFLNETLIYERRFTAIDFARDFEVDRIYGRLARERGPFAVRLYRWPHGAGPDQTERCAEDGVLRSERLSPGRHRLCLEVVEAGGYVSEREWEIEVRPPLLPRRWEACRFAEDNWQLALRLATPIDSLRLPLWLHRCRFGEREALSARGTARPASGEALPAPGEPCAEWAPLTDGWFVAPVPAGSADAVCVTDAAGEPVLPWMAIGDAPEKRGGEGNLRLAFQEGFVELRVQPARPLRGLPEALLEDSHGRFWPLALRPAPDVRSWSFAVRAGALQGMARALILRGPGGEETMRLPVHGLGGVAQIGEEASWSIDGPSGVRLRGSGRSLCGPLILRIAALAAADSLRGAVTDGEGRAVWRADEPEGATLPICSPIWRIDPVHWPLRGPCELYVARKSLSRDADLRYCGLARCDADGDWHWLGGAYAEEAWIGRIPALGTFAVLSDRHPPLCSQPDPPDGSTQSATLQRLAVRVEEVGSGFDPRQADLFLDGTPLLAIWDVDAHLLWAEVEGALAPGRHRWEARIVDRVGHEARATYAFTVGP